MTSRRALTVSAMVIWAAVAVTAAPRALSHRRSPTISSSMDFPAETCADLHIRFDRHDTVLQSEDRTITKAEAPTLRVHAESNGGVYVVGWDKDACDRHPLQGRRGRFGRKLTPFTDSPILSERRSAHFCPEFQDRWAAHLLIHAPKSSALDVQVNNGPMILYHVDGNLRVRAENGPVTVTGCTGELDLASENGPLTLEENSGKQTVRSERRALTLALSGSSWEG